MSQIQETKTKIANFEESIKDADALSRLAKNRDFVRLFDKGLFGSELLMFTSNIGNPHAEPERVEHAKEMVQAIGKLSFHLKEIKAMGNCGPDLQAHEHLLAELEAGE